MILTGPEIAREREAGRIVIDPYDPSRIEPNSYGFRLGSTLICYDDEILDARTLPAARTFTIPDSGYILQPGKFYLGCTLETMGSDFYAATLYARRSTSTMGIWIQLSAPLGHTGAKIPWTLEITVCHPIIVYPGMPIGKIAWWQPQGDRFLYVGKYSGSTDAVSSRLAREMTTPYSRRDPVDSHRTRNCRRVRGGAHCD